MEQKDAVQILANNFKGASSEFVLLNTLNTSSNLTSPYYALINATTTSVQEHIVLGIKATKSVVLVDYKEQEYKDKSLFSLEGNSLEQYPICCFTFQKEMKESQNTPAMIAGYQNGTIAHISSEKKLLNTFNYEEKDKLKYPTKDQPVILVSIIPDAVEQEFIALFADSSLVKYKISATKQNLDFMEKLKVFEQKINFKEHYTKPKSSKKEKNQSHFSFGSNLRENEPEFSYYYAQNDQIGDDNPRSFHKFNHRTISDLVVLRNKTFSDIFNKPDKKDIAILAFTSFDGYFVMFELSQMEPLLSYKSPFGGLNSVSFNRKCDLIALSGQDDCITVLDLNTMRTMRCEGHQSFVSKAIFHTIAPKSPLDQLKAKIKRNNREFERIIAGGLDGFLTFWEFDKELLRNGKSKAEVYPLRLKQNNQEDSITIRPLNIHKLKDPIGTIDLCSNMLFVSDQNGIISVYGIKDLVPKELDEQLSPLKRRKGGDSANDESISSENTWSKHREPIMKNPSGLGTRDERQYSYLPKINGEKTDQLINRKGTNSSLTNSFLDKESSLLSRKKPTWEKM